MRRPTSFFFLLIDRNDIQITSLEDVKKYRIGTVINDVREQFLLSKGFKIGVQLQSSQRYSQGFKKLILGRIDLWAMPEFTAVYIAQQEAVKLSGRLSP